MMSLWKAEQLKLRRSPVWLAFVVLPLFPAFFGTMNYLNNLELLKHGWSDLWTQHTLFSCYFFMPLVIAIYCAYLWRLEHNGYNWNAVLTTPVSRTAIVLTKLLSALRLSALMLLWTFFLYFAAGTLCGISGPFPLEKCLLWFACGLCGIASLCALQLFLGLLFRAFAVPVGIALMGGVLGLGVLSKGYGLYFPYSLLSLGMQSNGRENEIPLTFFISCFVMTVLFTALSALWIRRDAVTG